MGTAQLKQDDPKYHDTSVNLADDGMVYDTRSVGTEVFGIPRPSITTRITGATTGLLRAILEKHPEPVKHLPSHTPRFASIQNEVLHSFSSRASRGVFCEPEEVNRSRSSFRKTWPRVSGNASP